jgi:hypothetical protein
MGLHIVNCNIIGMTLIMTCRTINPQRHLLRRRCTVNTVAFRNRINEIRPSIGPSTPKGMEIMAYLRVLLTLSLFKRMVARSDPRPQYVEAVQRAEAMACKISRTN